MAPTPPPSYWQNFHTVVLLIYGISQSINRLKGIRQVFNFNFYRKFFSADSDSLKRSTKMKVFKRTYTNYSNATAINPSYPRETGHPLNTTEAAKPICSISTRTLSKVKRPAKTPSKVTITSLKIPSTTELVLFRPWLRRTGHGDRAEQFPTSICATFLMTSRGWTVRWRGRRWTSGVAFPPPRERVRPARMMRGVFCETPCVVIFVGCSWPSRRKSRELASRKPLFRPRFTAILAG